jgi:hypothetical protein
MLPEISHPLNPSPKARLNRSKRKSIYIQVKYPNLRYETIGIKKINALDIQVKEKDLFNRLSFRLYPISPTQRPFTQKNHEKIGLSWITFLPLEVVTGKS